MKNVSDYLIPRPQSVVEKVGCFRGSVSDLDIEIAPEFAPHEGYRLTISTEVLSLRASSEAGVFYGRQTLEQWRLLNEGSLICVEIYDYPKLRERGYMLDISRCRVPTMDTLFELVDLLSFFKYNQLQLYTEHTFAYEGHEQVWKNSSPLTPDEIRTLDVYCRERHIELVPNQNSLGHFERWLRHRDYHRFAECPDGFIHPISGVRKSHGSTLFPSKASQELVFDLYDQLLPNFSSRKFNVGCDEPWELGQGKSAQDNASGSEGDLFFDWLNRMCSRVDSLGFRPYFWADSVLKYEDQLERLPSTGCAVLWGYEADHPFDDECRKLGKAGVPFVISPGDSTWNSLCGRWNIAEKNIKYAANAAIEWGAEGLLLTQWGDQGHAQPWMSALPGALLGGAVSWNPLADYAELEAAIDAFVFKQKGLGMGSWIIKIGRIDERLGCARFNRSLLFGLVRESPFPGDLNSALEEISVDDLTKECESLRALLSKVDFADVHASYRLECDLVIRSLDVALSRLSDEVQESHVEELLEVAETVWLRRFRVGGLEESLNGYLNA